MAAQGPSLPTAAGTISNGDTAWASTGNIFAQDASYATASMGSGGPHTTDFLVGKTFGFSIPGGSTIDGITVVARAKAGTNGRAIVGTVKLTKNGTAVVGTDKGDSAAITTTEADFTYGSATDKWGTTWTDAEINATTFGIAFSFTQPGASGLVVISLNCFKITVNYTGPTGIRGQMTLIGVGT